MQGAVKLCAISQTRAQQNGQRLLAIELNAPGGDGATGTLVLPFGLALDSGVTFRCGRTRRSSEHRPERRVD